MGQTPFTIASQLLLNNVKVGDASVSVSDNLLLQYTDTIADGVTNQPIRLAFLHAQVKGYWLESDQDITLAVNSTGSPAPAISLLAGVPQFFVTGAGQTSLFAADVTEIFVSNASGHAANPQIYVLVHGSV